MEASMSMMMMRYNIIIIIIILYYSSLGHDIKRHHLVSATLTAIADYIKGIVVSNY